MNGNCRKSGRLLSFFLIFFIMQAVAGYPDEKTPFDPALPTVGIVISFDCVHCRTVFEKRALLSQACLEQSGKPRCNIRFFPFLSSPDDIRAHVFFAGRSQQLQRKLGDIMYSFSVTPAATETALRDLMRRQLPAFDWDQYYDSSHKSDSSIALKKTAALIVSLSISDYPSFLYFEKARADSIPVPFDPDLRLEEAVAWIRNNV